MRHADGDGRHTRAAALEFRSITKTFGGVTALNGVSFAVEGGECHALVGENGAGKSTLGKVLAGIHRPDRGTILIDGCKQTFAAPAQAARAGVGMVHQELACCPDLSVAENLCLGHYPRRCGVFFSRRGARARAVARLAKFGGRLDVSQPMRRLPTAQVQLVQIAAAIGTGARILVFDEPTSSLAATESQRLFDLIQSLRAAGVTSVYISHRLPEIFQLADHITVLRDGRYVGTLARSDASEAQLVQMMIGRPVAEYFPKYLAATPGRVLLEVENLSSPGRFSGVSLQVRAGEVVGLAGLVGAGRSELALAIFGLDPRARGALRVDGQPLPLGAVRQALRSGVGLVPEDRQRQGLVLMMSGRANFSLVMLDRLKRLLLLNQRRERQTAADFFERMQVKTPSIEAPVASLSGGNQQKVVLAKWLACRLKVLIVDEPTRGIDVGAKAAIHALIDELARAGLGILLISSELPELLNLSTRILIMRAGRLVGELPRAAATQESLLRQMAGVSTAAARAGAPL
jgi:ABC-type sugar transport system ATPase subunit